MQRLARFFSRREATTSIDVVRTSLGLVLLLDFVYMQVHGVPRAVYEGSTFADTPSWVTHVARHASPSSVVTAGAIAACFLASRILPRCAALVLLFVSAWLGFALPAVDRGVDALTRWALLYLALAPSGSSPFRRETPVGIAWPRRLLVFQLALVYTMAGFMKLSGPWSFEGGYRAVELSLRNTAYVNDVSNVFAATPWLCRVLTVATLAFERSAFLLLATSSFTMPGLGGPRVARALETFRRAWIATGVAFHVSLACVLALGSFPFVCLALYPALLRPDELSRVHAYAKQLRARLRAVGSPSPRVAT